MRSPALLPITLAGLLISLPVGEAHQQQGSQPVTPPGEQRSAPADAPSSTNGVSVMPLGTLDLSGEFNGLRERVLRTRRITVAPRGSVAWHEHEQRPGVAYLLNVALIQSHAWDAVFESSGVLHGWRNRSAQSVTAVVIDIVPVPEPFRP